MKTKTTKLGITLAGVLAFIVTSAHADTFGSGGNAFTIDFVVIGNAGNADDAGAGGSPSEFTPFGGVSYGYRMGTFEIAQDAITKAAASGVLNLGGGAWSATQSAANMTWFQAAAFVNWLNTSTGHVAAYQLDIGLTTLTLWDGLTQAWQAGGENLYRHRDAYYFLPSEDEWYKAAYHKNDGVTANYWDFATGSNVVPTAVISGTGAETAVYFGNGAVSPAAVNMSGGLSAYGTMGQNGNVSEWTESAFDETNDSSSEGRAFRGGHWGSAELPLRASFQNSFSPEFSNDGIGFRVASVPEPSSTVLMLSAGVLALARRRRRAAL